MAGIEMLGLMKRLEEVTNSVSNGSKKERPDIGFSHNFARLMMIEMDIVPVGSLAVNELLELFHDESVVSIFQFIGEDFEITPNQFVWGCLALPEQSGNNDVIGYTRIDGALWTMSREVSGEEWYFDAKAPWEARIARDLGTRIFSNAFKPNPILSRSFQPYALV
jgi:hypothetical protein